MQSCHSVSMIAAHYTQMMDGYLDTPLTIIITKITIIMKKVIIITEAARNYAALLSNLISETTKLPPCTIVPD